MKIFLKNIKHNTNLKVEIVFKNVLELDAVILSLEFCKTSKASINALYLQNMTFKTLPCEVHRVSEKHFNRKTLSSS